MLEFSGDPREGAGKGARAPPVFRESEAAELVRRGVVRAPRGAPPNDPADPRGLGAPAALRPEQRLRSKAWESVCCVSSSLVPPPMLCAGTAGTPGLGVRGGAGGVGTAPQPGPRTRPRPHSREGPLRPDPPRLSDPFSEAPGVRVLPHTL